MEAGWVYEPVAKHVCIRPNNTEVGKRLEGAIWCCGECGMYYEIYWDERYHTKEMRPISPVDAESRLKMVSA